MFKWLILVLIPVSSLCLSSCGSDDDEPEGGFKDKVSSQTKAAITSTFPGLRLDSINSHEDYGNIKITYRNGLLNTYAELYSNKHVHDGVYWRFRWTSDTVFMTCNSKTYKGVFGENGCMEKLICPNGVINSYEYNDGYLIKYHYDLTRHPDDEFMELTWENGNVKKSRSYYRYEDSNDKELHYVDVNYTYGEDINIAGLLPPLRSYNWIKDAGLSVGYGVNEAMYYAGILGKGTNNLPIYSSNKYYDGQQNQHYSFEYYFDEEGYVTSASVYRDTDYYFYSVE